MSRRPNPRAELMRLAVAEEAARIMGEQGVDDFLQAKRKAAERLGVTDASILPRNTEIEAALFARRRLFAGERHAAEIASLRRSALEAMRLMADFEPRLVGPVLAGTASAHSEINLHLFSESPEAVSLQLEERGVPHDVQRASLAIRTRSDGVLSGLALRRGAPARRRRRVPARRDPAVAVQPGRRQADAACQHCGSRVADLALLRSGASRGLARDASAPLPGRVRGNAVNTSL